MKYRFITSRQKLYSAASQALLLCTAFLAVLLNDSIPTCKWCAGYVLLLSGILVYRARKNWKGLIIFGIIFLSNYSFLMSNLFSPLEIHLTGWRNDTPVMVEMIDVLVVFITVVFVFCPHFERDHESFFDHQPDDPLLVCALAFLLLIILIYGYTRPGAYEERGVQSPLFEYSAIFSIVALYYARRKWERALLCALMSAYVIVCLLYGERATALQLLIVLFLIFVSDKEIAKYCVPLVFVCYLAFEGIGKFRAFYTWSFDSLAQSFREAVGSRFVVDTAYSAFFTSGTFVAVAKMLPFGERVRLLGSFVLSIFAGGSRVPDAVLHVYTRKYYLHYSGGVLPYYGFFYLGYPGVVLISGYLCFLMRKLLVSHENGRNGLLKCLTVYFTSNVPRWYLYTPLSLFRGIMLLMLLYGACWFFHSSVLSVKKKRVF